MHVLKPPWALVATALLVGSFITLHLHTQHKPPPPPPPELPIHTSSSQRDVLVLYHLSLSDSLGAANLLHFIAQAVLNDQRCNFTLLIPSSHPNASHLPHLPPHASYLLHDSPFSMWGTFGWALQHLSSTTQLPTSPPPATPQLHLSYTHLILVDSSVRGPFLPPMLAGLIPWWQPLLSLASSSSSDIALAGATISCEDGPLADDPPASDQGEGSHHPHFQDQGVGMPHVQLPVAMTAATLRLLVAQGVFDATPQPGSDAAPGPDPADDRPASAAVLRAGGALRCLMTRYAGVDWQQRRHWGCNARLPPHGEFAYDGISPNPHETLFVKVNSLLLQQHHPAAAAAERHDAWLHSASLAQRVLDNQFLLHTPRFKLPKILEKSTQGPECFDFDFFLQRNPDLLEARKLPGSSQDDIWQYFVFYGQFEPREFRFTCPMDYQQFAGFSLKLHQSMLARG